MVAKRLKMTDIIFLFWTKLLMIIHFSIGPEVNFVLFGLIFSKNGRKVVAVATAQSMVIYSFSVLLCLNQWSFTSGV